MFSKELKNLKFEDSSLNIELLNMAQMLRQFFKNKKNQAKNFHLSPSIYFWKRFICSSYQSIASKNFPKAFQPEPNAPIKLYFLKYYLQSFY